jgi:hypothetical protein
MWNQGIVTHLNGEIRSRLRNNRYLTYEEVDANFQYEY